MNFRKAILPMLAVTILTLSMHCTAFAANKTTLQVNNVVKTMTINTKKTLSIKSNGTVTCKTSNKNIIAVSKKKLTAKGTGIAEITVTSKKNGWKRTTKKFKVRVIPAQAKISSSKTTNDKISLNLKSLKGVSGYQIKYATNSKLTNAMVKTCKTTTFSFKTESNQAYYVVVRGFKKSGNTVLYGKWSQKKTIVSKHDHVYDKGVITTKPTCTDKGVKTYTCKNCGHTHTEEINALGHDYDNGVVVKEVTCFEEGIKTFTCKTCGDTYTESIPTTDAHIYDNGVVTKAPTCTETGIKTCTCTICGNKKTETIPVLDHDWLHYDAEGHNETVVVKEAWDETVYKNGYACNSCGAYFDTDDEAVEHIIFDCIRGATYSTADNVPVKIHHDAETKTIFVIDKPAYDECKNCHMTRESK